ncbi:alpha-N-arabinofuranosidase [Tessaracoccus bendigoensis DSM 12906]|uniref:non-reducing end alpha-L-arabinofuranosidase n=1 Tax=Tessaracoccus bendigoensis DSM 12906 TaxID=1123357 RepID=A0A1M6D0A5_9ACTN|nr:alpha-N-arabinofuranosidase [Tessaracoccus bendigoensis]SHI66639.1 alpha-N-arabinofuranosidase [Tessaracoccus bendigoensis DSM 12906]
MRSASLVVDPAFTVGPVRRRTFGSFVEHLGRCVYTGIYEPGHPTSDEDGFREDVLALTRELGVSTIRYPGGNFVSGYRWEDGVGPVAERPRRLDLAWHSMDPNTVGTDEFMKWAAKAGIEPMMAVNLGTRGTEAALDLLEYCNIPADSAIAERRRANGADEPYRVKMWCLGNEMDGPWQIGHKTAHEYGRLAAETARAMRMMDPSIELVACGSSSRAMPTFGEWERTVLTQAWEFVDMVSAHAYYWERGDDLQSFLGSAVDMDRFIEQVAATADAVGAANKSEKVIGISFDEWNVWYQDRAESKPPTGDDWPVAPVLLEDNYSVADAVVVGNLLISLLRHTDRVWSANLAQLVNVIAPIMTVPGGKAWKQTIFHPFALTARHASGEVLRVHLDSPQLPTTEFGTIPALDAVATSGDGNLTVFLVNRSLDESVTTSLDLRGQEHDLIEALTLSNDDPRYQASAEDDDTVVPLPNRSVKLDGALVELTLPPASWTMVRLAAR